MVNNVAYDFESLKLSVPAGPVAMCEEVSYDHDKEHKATTDTQGNIVGLIRGEFKGNVKIVMERSEFEKSINIPAAAFGGIYNAPPLDVVASYGALGQAPLVDVMQFKINKVGGLGGKKGDGLKITIEGPMTSIPVINGVPAFTPGI